MLETIHGREGPLALVIRRKACLKGTDFVTDVNNPLQVGIVTREMGDVISPHFHRKFFTKYSGIRQEVIFVVEGRLTAHIYDIDGRDVTTVNLTAGEALLQLAGGHGFYFDEPTRLLEVKQGPYSGRNDDKAPNV